MSTSLTPEQRYRAKLVPLPNGCVDWNAKIDKYGNSVFTYTVAGRHYDLGAHRFGWALVHEPIPAGYKLSNTCGFKACQNMDHWSLANRNLGRRPAEVYRSKFTVLGPDDCWPWQEQSRDKDGYGLMSWRKDGRTVSARAHRFGWDLAHPDAVLLDGEIICHSCDNPPCQNPAHWFKGTHQDNNDDMWEKGREVVILGTQRYNAVLDEEKVRYIRQTYIPGVVSQQTIANELGVRRKVVNSVITGKTWSWVPDESRS